ncbi:MAG: type II toxin-antitoxin system RelE/ParE family toxin [Dokdonella sp.]
MILSFRCAETQSLIETGKSRRFTSVASVAMRKLQQLESAETLDFLRAPPGNRLEALKRDHTGQHNIRVNDQWRVCFVWTEAGPRNVEIVDSH